MAAKGMKAAGELLPGREIVQLFRASASHLAIISPLIATYRQIPCGSLSMSLHRLAPAPRRRTGWRDWLASFAARDLRAVGGALAELTVPGRDLEDNAPLELCLPPIAQSAGEIFALRTRANETKSGLAPTVWLSAEDGRVPGHLACYVGGRAQGTFGVHATLMYTPPLASSSVPPALLYSPITQCNLNCIHCISRHTRTKASRLSDDIRAHLQDWCSTGKVRFLATDYSGDILWADARFGGELDFLFGLGVPFYMDTNGACLTADASERLCRSKLRHINISLDAAEEDTFRRVRKGAPPLSEITENIRGLMHARARGGAIFGVSISFTLMRSTLHEWPAFLRLASRLGVGLVHARHLEVYTADMEEESLWLDQGRYNAARPEAVELAAALGITLGAPPPFGGIPRRGHRPCAEPWSSAVVLGNGDVAACCVPGMSMGNLHVNTMEEIWNGPRYRELRATVNSANPPKPCASCPIYRRTDNADSYLIHRAGREPSN